MPLLNYTTSIPASRSIAEINKSLVGAGATSIMTDYDSDGEVIAISFRIDMNGQLLSFRLPIDWKATQQVLIDQRLQPRYRTEDHARRVAWRVTKDWVQAQMAMLTIRSVTLPQLFLPYAVAHDGQTLYEKIAQNPSLLLGDGQ